MQNTPIRNRKHKTYDKTFLFQCDQQLLNEMRDIATANYMSVATFLRQSALRNINAYRKLEV